MYAYHSFLSKKFLTSAPAAARLKALWQLQIQYSLAVHSNLALNYTIIKVSKKLA